VTGPAVVDAETLRRVLPMGAAVDALEAAFRIGPDPETPLRSHVSVAGGELLMMPASGAEGTGVKLVTVTPGNPARGLPLIHAVYVLFAAGTAEPVAVIDGSALTALRTAAVSGLATRRLANPGAATLVIFGAGVQASAHLEAMRAVRPVERVRIVSRTPSRAEAMAASARDSGVDAKVAAPGVVARADLVCTCTTSSEPVFDGALLPDGVHVNAVGSYQPTTRELDDATMARARIVVETREAALAEAGDLLIPLASGAIAGDAVIADLAEVVRGAAVRRDPGDVTVFTSVGVAFEDLAVARALVDRLG
jgi:ornithine cyclodeaminase/alanine dehydrogenase-like protein (mu-crystallin family)